MSNFTFNCPNCNTQLEGKDEWVNCQTECPSCHKSIVIPPHVEEAPKVTVHVNAPKVMPSPANEKKSTSLVGCSECGSFFNVASNEIGQEVTCPVCCEKIIAAVAEYRKCPSCDETVRIEAKICKSCHAALPPIKMIANGEKKSSPSPHKKGMAQVFNYIELPVGDIQRRTEMAELWKSLRLWSIMAVASTILSIPLMFIVIGFATLIFSVVAFVLAVIKLCKLLYRYWDYVGPEKGYTSGQMVGFLFIPVYRLYWAFVAIWGLAKKLKASGAEEVNSGLALALVICICAWFIPYLGFAAFMGSFVLFIVLFSQFNSAFTESN